MATSPHRAIDTPRHHTIRGHVRHKSDRNDQGAHSMIYTSLKMKTRTTLMVLCCYLAALLTQTQAQNGMIQSAGALTRGRKLLANAAASESQEKTVIDVRDTPGVDCTGTTDSSPGLNSLFTNITNAHVIIPNGCNLSIANQLVIFGQSSFVIDGQAKNPSGARGGRIYGCGGVNGPLLYINRSGNGEIVGLSLEAKGPGICTTKSLFTESIRVDNVGERGVTTTRLSFANNWITSSSGGVAVANYIGININSGQNMEDMRFTDNAIHCQKSQNSAGILIRGGNSDNDIIEGNNISGCFHGVGLLGGHATITNNKLSGNGIFGIFGANGADLFLAACTRPVLIQANGSSSSGPFLALTNNDTTGGCEKGIILIGNDIGIGGSECGGCTAMSPAAFPIQLGTNSGWNVLLGNAIATFGSATKPCVGSDSQGLDGEGYPHGPLGYIIDLGGNTCDTAAGLFQSGLAGNSYAPFQGGEVHPDINIPGTSGVLPQVLSSPIANIRTGNKSSKPLIFRGHFLNSAGISTNDDWTWQNVVGTRAHPTSTYTLTHKGSAGTATLAIPVQIVSTLPSGTAPLSVASNTVVPNLNSSYLNGFSITQLTDAPGAIIVDAGRCIDRAVKVAHIRPNATITLSASYQLEPNLAISPGRVETGAGVHYRICNVQSTGSIRLGAAATFTLNLIQ